MILRMLRGSAVVVLMSGLPTPSHALDLDSGLRPATVMEAVDAHLRTVRLRTSELAAITARIGPATAASATAVLTDGRTSGLGLLVRVLLLCLGGLVGSRLFWIWTAPWVERIANNPLATIRQRLSTHAQRILFAQGMVLSFAAGACLAYIAAAPAGKAGVLTLDALFAFIAVSSIRAVSRFLFAPNFARIRLVALPTAAACHAQRGVTAVALVLVAGLLWAALLRLQDPASPIADAVASLTLGAVAVLVPVVIAIVSGQRRTDRDPLRPAVVVLGAVPGAAWLLAQGDLPALAWSILVLGAVPAFSLILGEAARTIAFGPNRSGRLSNGERTAARAARNGALIAALLLVAGGPPGARAGFGVSVSGDIVSALLILLGTDLAWQLVRGLIDRGLARADADPRGDRLATILPALRTVVFVALLITGGLSIASTFGLQIGPFLAGAGVVGLTIGFGAQALVRDVIAGFFLLLDDAFRVGESIGSGGLQGRVEAFSLRSVRLRDDDGHMHTVAFGELKAVTNVSRDWAGLEIPIYVRHDVSFDAVAGVIESAILSIREDADIGAHLLTPPKFLGATTLSESSIRLAVLVRTLPGRQAEVKAQLLRLILSGAEAAKIRLGAIGPVGSAIDRDDRAPVLA